MDIRTFIEQLENRLKEEIDIEYEIYYSKSNSSAMKVFDQTIESYTKNDVQGLSLRLKKNDKIGGSYTESFLDSEVEDIIKRALDNLSVIEIVGEEDFLAFAKSSYHKVNPAKNKIRDMSQGKKLEALKKLESTLKKATNVKAVTSCTLGESIGREKIINSKGLNVGSDGSSCYIYASVLGEKDGVRKTAGHHILNPSEEDINNIEIFAQKIIFKLEKKLEKYCTLESKSYQAILTPAVFSDLLGSYWSIFSAEKIQKQGSKLKGQLNQIIASPKLTLIDNPHIEGGVFSKSYDGEGAPTKIKYLVDSGVFKEELHNQKTAKKANLESGGNASRQGYKGGVAITTSNLQVLKTKVKKEEMLQEVAEGVLIDGIVGLHSGVDLESGDFSLSGEGNIIKDGILKERLASFIVSGNFYELIKDIQEVGNEAKFGSSITNLNIASPHILVVKLNISF